jgi:hypothetical protein
MINKQIIIDFSDVNQDILLCCAFRYALGRRTYVVGTLVDILKSNWGNIPKSRREMFKKEIREAIKYNMCGSKYDIEEWEEILKLGD